MNRSTEAHQKNLVQNAQTLQMSPLLELTNRSGEAMIQLMVKSHRVPGSTGCALLVADTRSHPALALLVKALLVPVLPVLYVPVFGLLVVPLPVVVLRWALTLPVLPLSLLAHGLPRLVNSLALVLEAIRSGLKVGLSR